MAAHAVHWIGGTEIYVAAIAKVSVGVAGGMNPQQRLALINIVGLTSLSAFTGLVYLRTQDPLILLVGGLIGVVGVLGMMTSKV